MKEKEITFDVNVIECNADKFNEDYKDYINFADETPFGDWFFSLTAPQSVYEEIAGLEEECITILEESISYPDEGSK